MYATSDVSNQFWQMLLTKHSTGLCYSTQTHHLGNTAFLRILFGLKASLTVPKEKYKRKNPESKTVKSYFQKGIAIQIQSAAPKYSQLCTCVHQLAKRTFSFENDTFCTKHNN